MASLGISLQGAVSYTKPEKGKYGFTPFLLIVEFDGK